jgi:hypothetical protein
MIKEGSLWGTGEGKFFRVLSVKEIDGHTWVHYREDQGIKVPALECREYSCYQESFLQRFRQVPE